ncbi:MAG: flagellar protein FlgN [Elusimicrobia bacterium]|nr:flagellar protein FlgN [Elusimicrobiota bacterium]
MTAGTGLPRSAFLPRLVASLDAIVALCDDLRSVLEREREALTKGKDDELAVALGEKRDRLRRMSEAEEERRKASEDVSESLGLGRADFPLAEVAGRLDEPARDQLILIKDRLFQCMKEVGALNQGNARLIRRAQHYNRHLIGLLADGGSDTYGPDGSPHLGAPGIFQKRA